MTCRDIGVAASWLEKTFCLSGPRYDRVMPRTRRNPCRSYISLNSIDERYVSERATVTLRSHKRFVVSTLRDVALLISDIMSGIYSTCPESARSAP